MQIDDLSVPNGWHLSTVGECCEINNSLREPISASERKLIRGKYPYYGPTGILDYIDGFRVEGQYALIGEDGDHFLKFSDIDMTLLVEGKFNVNNHAHLVQGKGNCTTAWFYNFFRRADLHRYITRQGAGRYKLNRAALETLPILVPPLNEQVTISEILSTWDTAIDRVEQLIAALQRRKQGLMQRLLTGQVRFAEFAGQDWPTEKAGAIFQPHSSRKNGGAELLSVTQDLGVVPRSVLETRVVMPSGSTDSYKLVEPGDFIISLRSFQGGIEYSQYRGLVSPAYTVLKPKLPICDGFFRHLLKSKEFIARLGVAIIGIRDGKQINFEDFAGIRLAYPSLDEQQAISRVLDTSDEEIALYQRQLQALARQKKGLMQRLLTGQVRVEGQEHVPTA